MTGPVSLELFRQLGDPWARLGSVVPVEPQVPVRPVDLDLDAELVVQVLGHTVAHPTIEVFG
jgi:hypothetical protein